jgi:hypothetical protein
MNKLIELAVLELNKNITESEHDPEVHVYHHPENKHLETMKLSAANKKYKTNITARGVGTGSFGINSSEGAAEDMPFIPKPGRKSLRFQHASHKVGSQ